MTVCEYLPLLALKGEGNFTLRSGYIETDSEARVENHTTDMGGFFRTRAEVISVPCTCAWVVNLRCMSLPTGWLRALATRRPTAAPRTLGHKPRPWPAIRAASPPSSAAVTKLVPQYEETAKSECPSSRSWRASWAALDTSRGAALAQMIKPFGREYPPRGGETPRSSRTATVACSRAWFLRTASIATVGNRCLPSVFEE